MDTSFVLVGCGSNERAIAIDAARSLFPEAIITDVADLDSLFARIAPHSGQEFVVVAKGAVGQIARAIDATDASGLPRWGVVVLGQTPVDDATGFVPYCEWTSRSAALALRSTALLHAARRENARLHGELRTVATRFSHDVRAPLGAIFTTCELINEMDTAPEADLIHAIRTSASEVSNLVDRIALVLRAPEGGSTADLFAMSDAVFRSLHRVECECREKQVSIVVPREWPTVRGVLRNLEVVWDCLLASALKFGGESPAIRLGWNRASKDYEFWLEGNGTVPREQQHRVFSPLHTLHEQHDGAGLDLAIVRRLVELEGGQCQYQALPSGSRFQFTLPHPEE